MREFSPDASKEKRKILIMPESKKAKHATRGATASERGADSAPDEAPDHAEEDQRALEAANARSAAADKERKAFEAQQVAATAQASAASAQARAAETSIQLEKVRMEAARQTAKIQREESQRCAAENEKIREHERNMAKTKAASPSKPPPPPGVGTCLLQGCTRPRFVDHNAGRHHEYCGVTHAQQGKAMPEPGAFKDQGERKMQEMVQGMNRRATEGEIAQEGYQRQQRIQAAGMAASQDVERQVMQAMDQIQKPTNCTIEPCDQRVINDVKHLSKNVEQSSVTIAEAASMLQASADSKDDHKRQLLHAEVLQLLTQTSKEGKSMSTRVIDTIVKTVASVTIKTKGGQHHCTHCQVAGHSIQYCRNIPRNNTGGAQGGGGGGQGAQNQPGRQQHANMRAPFGRW